MTYVFKNSKELEKHLDSKNILQLVDEFGKAEIAVKEDYREVFLSAKELYRRMCLWVSKTDKEALKVLNKKALELFTQAWDVDALTMIKGSKMLFGELDEMALKVLEEYEYYKNETKKVLGLATDDKKLNVSRGDGVSICISPGKASFIREGKEYVVFFFDN